MAKSPDKKRKPRIRKSAPTFREQAEATQTKSEKPKKRPVRSALRKITTPFKKLRLGERRIFKPIRSLFGLIKRAVIWITPKYFINSWRELRKVVWPGAKETFRLTLAVFIFAIVFGALVAGVDKSLDEIFKKLVLK